MPGAKNRSMVSTFRFSTRLFLPAGVELAPWTLLRPSFASRHGRRVPGFVDGLPQVDLDVVSGVLAVGTLTYGLFCVQLR